jgi:hypothetical protein
MNLQKDLKEFVELLTELDVRFLIVGAFAVAYHGYPRYTADIDIFVDNSVENAARLLEAIQRFGFGNVGLTDDDFVQDDRVIQLGVAPNRIDLLTSISGVSFEEAWRSRELGELGELTVPFISREMLKRNKAATGRSQDLADLDRL